MQIFTLICRPNYAKATIVNDFKEMRIYKLKKKDYASKAKLDCHLYFYKRVKSSIFIQKIEISIEIHIDIYKDINFSAYFNLRNKKTRYIIAIWCF
jgi:hypothetical protein